MNVLLVNDTRNEDNVGCHATVDELERFLKKHLNCVVIEKLFMGAEYDEFSARELFSKTPTIGPIQKLQTKLRSSFQSQAPWDYAPRLLNYEYWKNNYKQSFSQGAKRKFEEADFVVINMEGTMHHNSLGAVVLLSIAHFCKTLGKIVWMVNGTYQLIDERLTKEILPAIDLISVREPWSKKYLQTLVSGVEVVPDFAFRADIATQPICIDGLPLKEGKNCLYTAGVLAAYSHQRGGESVQTVLESLKAIRDAGYEPYYLEIENREQLISEVLREHGFRTLTKITGAKWRSIGNLLDLFDLVITGRYHIGIFSIMRRRKTILKRSNTFKIEGLAELVRGKHMVISNVHPRTIKKMAQVAHYENVTQLGFESKYEKLAKALHEIVYEMP